MIVYVAEAVTAYEGSQILGIFTTKEKAEEVGQQRRHIGIGNFMRGDYLEVTEWEVEE